MSDPTTPSAIGAAIGEQIRFFQVELIKLLQEERDLAMARAEKAETKS